MLPHPSSRTETEMSIDDSAVTAERLRSSALSASRRAQEARQLAFDIDVRRLAIGTRIDASVAQHTADMWHSRAAERSRTELQRGVGFMVGRTVQGLRETRIALERRADDLDDDARTYRREATAIESDLIAAALTSTSMAVVDMPWLEGIG